MRRYPCRVTPEQLSTAIVDVLTALSGEGAITLPDGVPTNVTVERPRQKGHGDYATNVALQLAKKAGLNPRDLATLVAAGARGDRRHRRGRDRRPGLPQHHGRRRCPGHRRGADRRRRGGVRRQRRVRRREDQPRVRLREPDRPDPHRRGPLGGGRRRARPDLRDDRSRGHPRVLLQRPRCPDRPVQPLAAGQRQGRAGAGGRVRRRTTSTRSPRPSWRGAPRSRTCADADAQEVFRATGVEMMFERDQAEPPRLRGRLRRLLPREQPAQERCRRPGHRPAHRDGQHLRAGRRPVAAHRAVR